MKNKFEERNKKKITNLNISSEPQSLVKAELAMQIYHVVKKKKLTQKKAAFLLGVDQPKVSALLSGRLSGFSLERLFRFLNELDQDVTIDVRPKFRSQKKGSISISTIDKTKTCMCK